MINEETETTESTEESNAPNSKSFRAVIAYEVDQWLEAKDSPYLFVEELLKEKLLEYKYNSPPPIMDLPRRTKRITRRFTIQEANISDLRFWAARHQVRLAWIIRGILTLAYREEQRQERTR